MDGHRSSLAALICSDIDNGGASLRSLGFVLGYYDRSRRNAFNFRPIPRDVADAVLGYTDGYFSNPDTEAPDPDQLRGPPPYQYDGGGS